VTHPLHWWHGADATKPRPANTPTDAASPSNPNHDHKVLLEYWAVHAAPVAAERA
jgi:hypothetical protein